MSAEIFQGGLEILEELPSLSPGERRFTVRWPASEEGRALLIHTQHAEPVPGDLLAQRRALAARLQRRISPHMASVLEYQLTAEEDYLLADQQGNIALRDVLRRRRKLRVEEIFALLQQIHTAVYRALRAEWPRLSLDARALLIKLPDPRGEMPLDLSREYLKFPPPSLPALSTGMSEFGATMTMDPVAIEMDMGASVPTSSAVYVQSAAELCCELLGQPRRAGAIHFQPIPDLGADENEVLRQVLVSPLGSPPCDSLGEFIEALTQQPPPDYTQEDAPPPPVVVQAPPEPVAAPEPQPEPEPAPIPNFIPVAEVIAQEPVIPMTAAEFAATPVNYTAPRAPEPVAPTTAVGVPGQPDLFNLKVAGPAGMGLLIKPLKTPDPDSETGSLPVGQKSAPRVRLPSATPPAEAPAPEPVHPAAPPKAPTSNTTAGLEKVSAEARAAVESKPKPPPARIQVKPRETAPVSLPPVTAAGDGTLLLGAGIMLPPMDKVFDRLRLLPERDVYPIIGLSARKEIVMGRSPHDNDYVAQFRPRSPMNDSRTLKISRSQLKLAWGRGDVVEVKDTGSQNSSRIGEEPITAAVEITGANRVVLAGEYAVRVSRFPTAFPSQRRVIRLDTEGEKLPDDTLMSGGVGVEPLERQVLPFRLAWLGSDVAFAIDEKSSLYFMPPANPAAQGRFHYYGNAFWLEVIKPELGFWVEMTKLNPGQVAPLTPGLQLQIAGVTYRVAAEGAE
jgi:hypothetical protein